MDDVGASTKQYNQHGKKLWKIFGRNLPVAFFANWLFFKRIKPFSNWAPYSELNVTQWKNLFLLLRKYNATLTVGITASWAKSENELISFDKKFPNEYSIIKEGVEENILEIANHGLTHCVLIDNLFYPKLFSSNRDYHREFWDWLPDEYHRDHIVKSQDILTKIFKTEILTFIPPGGIWTNNTEEYAYNVGIRFISAKEDICPTGLESNGITYVGNKNMIDFHDRDLVLYGFDWLENQIKSMKNTLFCTVKSYCNKNL